MFQKYETLLMKQPSQKTYSADCLKYYLCFLKIIIYKLIESYFVNLRAFEPWWPLFCHKDTKALSCTKIT